jgi:hypothetical protein
MTMWLLCSIQFSCQLWWINKCSKEISWNKKLENVWSKQVKEQLIQIIYKLINQKFLKKIKKTQIKKSRLTAAQQNK